jgi:hypothetical protein
MRRVHLSNRLLPIELFVLVGPARDAQAWCNKRHAPVEMDVPSGSGLAFVHALAAPKVGFESVIWMADFRKGNSFDAGRLAHEALHVAWRLLEKLGSYDEETHCYMVQWIVEETTRRLNSFAKG